MDTKDKGVTDVPPTHTSRIIRAAAPFETMAGNACTSLIKKYLDWLHWTLTLDLHRISRTVYTKEIVATDVITSFRSVTIGMWDTRSYSRLNDIIVTPPTIHVSGVTIHFYL